MFRLLGGVKPSGKTGSGLANITGNNLVDRKTDWYTSVAGASGDKLDATKDADKAIMDE